MKSLFYGSAALLALGACPALAQENAGDIIVTATGAPLARAQSGQAVSVLTARDIAERQTVSAADLIATLPGISMSRNGPLGGFTAVRIRGAQGEQTLALIDGVKVNDPSSPGGGFDFGALLTDTIDRIEVLRGPNSVPWGSEAIGGVINIVTAQPKSGLSGSAKGEYGYGDAGRLVGRVSGGNSRIRATFGGGWFTQDGISAFKNGSEADGLKQYGANGRIDMDLTPGIALDLRGWYAHSRIEQDGFPPPFYGFADTSDYVVSEQIVGYAGLKAQTGQILHRLAVTLSDVNRDNFAQRGDPAPQYLNRGQTERYEYRADWAVRQGLRALIGLEHERTRADDGYALEKTHVSSGFAQILADPIRSLTLTAGIRLDDHATYGQHVTPSANFAWRAGPSTLIRAAYGEGFKAPTLFQLYSSYGNQSLQPEMAQSFDLGIEQALIADRLLLTATLFQRDSTDQIDFISCAGRTSGICQNRRDGTYDNKDNTRARGIELTTEFHLTDAINLTANYTYLDAKDRTTGQGLIRRPRHNLSADIDWQSPMGLRLGGSLRLASKSDDTDFETYAPVSLGSYTLMGLRASLPLSSRFEIYGRVENLLNTRYETVSGYGSYGRAAYAGVRASF